MMSTPFEVEFLRDGLYLVRGEVDGDPAEVQFRIEEDELERLGLPHSSGADVVAATASYLLEHQRLDELPDQVQIEDVSQAYADFAAHLRTVLG